MPIKSKLISMISSNKNVTLGHQIRRNIINNLPACVDLYGRGFKEIENKIEGLKDYRYHFAIENCKKDVWFTEKLIDCLVTGTIPVYWGCPSISAYFNDEGFIIFNDLVELKDKLKLCTPEYYESKLPVIRENLELAKKYLLSENWIHEHELYIS
jgi:hypothetical protein